MPAMDGQPDSALAPARWRWIALFFYCTALALLMVRHTFWRDELRAWNVAVYTGSLRDMFRQMPSEGHPALWFLLLRCLAILWNSPQAMLLLHWAIASLNAWLILWFCPLPAWQRLCCCFGYFLLFEYGVICRDYALGLSLAFVFAIVCGRFRNAVIGPALILALMPHANLFAAFLGISLLAWLVAAKWRRVSRASVAGACLIVGASTLLMLSYVGSPWGDGIERSNLDYVRQNPRMLAARTKMFLDAAVPAPRPGETHFWGTNWTGNPSIHPQCKKPFNIRVRSCVS